MKLHYYESILNFYCDSLTEEGAAGEDTRMDTAAISGIRKKREEEEGGNGNTRVR